MRLRAPRRRWRVHSASVGLALFFLGNLLLLRLGARHEQMVADFCEEALEALSAMSCTAMADSSRPEIRVSSTMPDSRISLVIATLVCIDAWA